ncbi:HPr family phosphocarrier protein [Thermaerobacillus caldiproteolyticus]|uniref:Phosphocarrier protein HPr n=1 Tax=Thermaerobacillus caldiproteolyticus TaxID=247480 RepID=A0A7W0BYT9_9BACL|nr:HPr family phosphocarrier protein [Anoxybacillus caldiproteolyticus]MBA2876066.1 catabolite repression HPr-like protein/phosphocarrier protein [Anoxybacillus caldiproteolyticus]QPA32293.1 HPr family phosphocarrier protein [Anoxybacillus caldiproteolyticus]
MIEKEISVIIENGLHARPAADFVKKVNQYKSKVELVKGEKRINAKSILNLMSIAVKEGQTIKVIIDGEDEKEALAFVESFLQSGKE